MDPRRDGEHPKISPRGPGYALPPRLRGEAFNQRLFLGYGQLLGSRFDIGERAHAKRLNCVLRCHQVAKRGARVDHREPLLKEAAPQPYCQNHRSRGAVPGATAAYALTSGKAKMVASSTVTSANTQHNII